MSLWVTASQHKGTHPKYTMNVVYILGEYIYLHEGETNQILVELLHGGPFQRRIEHTCVRFSSIYQP